jgi:hypothetical protein
MNGNYSNYQVGKPQCEHLARVRERDAHTFGCGLLKRKQL